MQTKILYASQIKKRIGCSLDAEIDQSREQRTRNQLKF